MSKGKKKHKQVKAPVARMSVKRLLLLTVKKFFDPFYAGGAAEVAFFLLLSLVPTTILFARIAGIFTISMDAIRELLSQYIQGEVLGALLPLLDYNPSNAFSVLLILLAMWSGSKALVSLMRMSNYATGNQATSKNPVVDWLRRRGRAIFTTVVILITLIFALYVLVFGEVIVRLVLKYLNDYLGEHYSFSAIWYTLRWIIAFILYLFTVIAVYYMLPNRDIAISRQIVPGFFNTVRNIITTRARNNRAIIHSIVPGAIFAAVGMLIATWLYAIYIRFSSAGTNFNILYGGMTSVVLLLVWFYVIAFVLIIGIQFNAAWAESRGEKEKDGHGGHGGRAVHGSVSAKKK
ncbi:MAG: YihY/virulence factor BrkB family protein [Clostridiales Family XIII bacterium]|nr:YihY/virulence factor BrkB family protein [Clostridiales Family XIII bacterium]